MTGLLVAAALVLAWRRAAGVLQVPLSPAALGTLGLLAAACAWAVRAARSHAALSRLSGRAIPLLDCLASVSLVGLGAALSLPDSQPAALVFFWVVFGAEELCTWIARARGKRGFGRCLGPAETGSTGLAGSAGPLFGRGWPAPNAAAGQVVQQLVRSRAADGTETLCGRVRIAVAPWQRTATAHVAFCPPFAHTPRLTFQQQSGPAARIKPAQLLPYGARFDLKLTDGPQSATSILLEFAAEGKAAG
ncbi:MAG: hypothetical protein ACUVUC_08020 [Thermoguttaceae bacterium]